MAEIYTQQLKGFTGNGSGSVKFEPSAGKRLHGVGLTLTYASGVSTSGDSLAEQVAAISEIRVKVGTKVRWRLSGTQLLDFVIFQGAAQTWDYTSYVSEIYLPFSPDWYIANVADALAWNPALLGAGISIELDITALNSTYYPTISGYERVSDDLDAPSAGILTLEVIKPVGGSTLFYAEKEVEARGRLLQASIYADGGAITKAGLMVGSANRYAWENLTLAAMKQLVCQAGFDSPGTARSAATIYDMVFVRGDALSHAIDLEKWGKAKFELYSASFTGAVPILLARLESK
jgi:hypothetical protein